MSPAIQPCTKNVDFGCQKSKKAEDCFNRIAEMTLRASKNSDQVTRARLLAQLKQHKYDQKAQRRARASAAVYDIDVRGQMSKPTPCLTLVDTNSPQALRQVEAELGLQPNSLNVKDFASEQKGYRAALFFDQRDRKYVVAFRGTNKNNLIDWKNNINNQLPNATADDAPSYFAAQRLGGLLVDSRPPVDYTGHSKGGGEVFEALSNSAGSEAIVFNAAGPSPRIDADTRANIAERVQAYQVGGEMLNLMQDETDPQRIIADTKWLRDQVNNGLYGTAAAVKITERDNVEQLLKKNLKGKTGYLGNFTTEQKAAQASLDELNSRFERDRSAFVGQLDQSIARNEANLREGRPVTAFAQVIGQRRVVGGDPSRTAPGLGALRDHTMENMISALDKQTAADQAALEAALPRYAPNFDKKVSDCTESFHCD